jgi:lysyl-tRNA synthetase class II
MIRLAQSFLLLAVLPSLVAAQSASERLNDYPTAARADYVFACMAANGQSREILERCACSIDEIASILPYEKYLEAETVLSMRRVGGERMAFFVSSAMAETIVADMRRAQAEAEIVCF